MSVHVFTHMFVHLRSGSPARCTRVPRNRLGKTVGHTKANEAARRMLTVEHEKCDHSYRCEARVSIRVFVLLTRLCRPVSSCGDSAGHEKGTGSTMCRTQKLTKISARIFVHHTLDATQISTSFNRPANSYGTVEIQKCLGSMNQSYKGKGYLAT